MLRYKMNYLRTYVEEKITIDDKEWKELSSIFRKKIYNKKENLLKV